MTSGDWVQIVIALAAGAGATAGGLVHYFNGKLDSERGERAQDRHDLRSEMTAIAGALAGFKEHIANNYPSYQRMDGLLKPIGDGIDEIKADMRDLFRRLDGKADK